MRGLKLSNQETEILFKIECLCGTKEIIDSYAYAEILNSWRDVNKSMDNINRIKNLFDIYKLASIIREENLKKFDIEKISEKSLYKILDKLKRTF